jgi:hypothetical protein
MAKSWISFEERMVEDRKRTREWLVKPTYSEERRGLGEIRWYAPWRRYCFYPYVGTVFEEKCLRNIAEFCEQQTQEQRSTWKHRR